MALLSHVSQAKPDKRMDQLHLDLDPVPMDHLPKFVHQCIDQMCGRDGVRHRDWVPEIFADAESVDRATDWYQQLLMRSIDTRDKNDVSPLLRLLLLMQRQANTLFPPSLSLFGFF